MEKEIAKRVVELMEVHNSASDYKWRVESENLAVVGQPENYFITVYPYIGSMYATEITDLVCIATSFKLSFWLSTDEDKLDDYRKKVVFHCA